MLRVFRPSIEVQPTATELDCFHQNVVSFADLGKVFAIEVLVEGVCLAADQLAGETGKSSILRSLPVLRKRSHGKQYTTNDNQRSALSLVYDDHYHPILMKHSDVTMGVTSGLKSNQVAKLLRYLVTLHEEVQHAAAEWDIQKRRHALESSLRKFNETLKVLKPMTPTRDQDEYDAYCKLYRNLEQMSEQVVLGRSLRIDFAETDVQYLPHTLRAVGELLRSLNMKDSVDVLVPNADSYRLIREALNAITLPAERLICNRLIMDLWLLEDWSYDREV